MILSLLFIIVNNFLKDFFKSYIFLQTKSKIYKVEPSSFQEGKTSFNGEVVSEEPVKVLSATKVPNLYKILKGLEKEGKIKLYEHSQDKTYQEKMDDHIEKAIDRIDFSAHPSAKKFCTKHFPHIMKKRNEQQHSK